MESNLQQKPRAKRYRITYCPKHARDVTLAKDKGQWIETGESQCDYDHWQGWDGVCLPIPGKEVMYR